MTNRKLKIDKEFEKGIEAGLNEAIAYFGGKRGKAREIKITFCKVPNYTASRIRKLREKFHFTREGLGLLMNVSYETIKKWEEGENRPAGASARMLQLLENNPEAVLSTLEVRSL
ncbi:MAG: helix-turn-helix domain-containing protein [Oligoflexales bacterium]|nr:helix-turn-helix domain-containing protein [Oligoflexales bacterium]